MSTQGLTTAESNERLIRYGRNLLARTNEKNLLFTFLSLFREPMLLLLIAAGLISVALAELIDGLLLLFTIFIIVGITFYQTRKTEKALEALSELTMPLALVIRDGREKRIPSSEIVPGDLIVLREGDRIGADARLITSASLQIDESLLTGESVPVLKNVGDSAYTGSLVVRG
ncbi:MAG: HAD-IC family P-type ATPase, partial [Actinomycetales bacterium]